MAMKPAWLRRRTDAPVVPPRERSVAMVNATGRVLDRLDAQIKAHGADGLPEWLTANVGGLGLTDKACALQRVMREGYSRDVVQACRDALP